VTLSSTGLCGTGRVALSIVADKGVASVAAMGVFADGDLIVRPGSVIDSYDSTAPKDLIGGLLGGIVGALVSTNASRVGSNSNIELQATRSAPTRIEGNVAPGVSGTVIRGSGVTVTGSTLPRSKAVKLPPIDVPPLSSSGNLLHSSAQVLTLAAGEHRYDSLVLGPGAKVLVKGPQTLVISSLVLGQGAELSFDTTLGKVEVHVTDYMNLAASTKLNNLSEEPAKLRMLISASQTLDRNGDGIPDPPVSLGVAGKLHATMYAPEAALTLPSSLELFGAVTAASLVLNENSRVHFDQALLENDGSGPQVRQQLAWRVLELPDEPLVAMRVDPVTALKQSGIVAAAPVDAHQTEDFKIEFVSLLGKTLTWVGEEAKFNWLLVSSVVKTSRSGDADFIDF
jgi:hypothetical protein